MLTHKNGLISRESLKFFSLNNGKKVKLQTLKIQHRPAGAIDEEVENFMNDFKKGEKKISLLAKYSKRASKLVV
jgi:hypothetical protein